MKRFILGTRIADDFDAIRDGMGKIGKAIVSGKVVQAASATQAASAAGGAPAWNSCGSCPSFHICRNHTGAHGCWYTLAKAVGLPTASTHPLVMSPNADAVQPDSILGFKTTSAAVIARFNPNNSAFMNGATQHSINQVADVIGKNIAWGQTLEVGLWPYVFNALQRIARNGR